MATKTASPLSPRKKINAQSAHNPSALEIKPLYALDAEKAVIGAMIVHPDAIHEVAETLVRSDFFAPQHQILFDAIMAMYAAGQPIEILTLHQYLLDHRLADTVGSPGILAELTALFVSRLNLASYIKTVRDRSILRRLQEACIHITNQIADSPHDVDTILDQAESQIFQITNQNLTQTTSPAPVEVDRALSLIENFQKYKGRLRGIPTPFGELDTYTTGWQNSDMIVLAARPGVGKTALALNFATFAARKKYDEKTDSYLGPPGHPVGIFSLEMTNSQLMLRILSATSGVPLRRIREGNLSPQDLVALQKTADEIKQWPLYLDDSPRLTINQLRGKARRMKEQFKIELLIIDYLQLLYSESPQARENRTVEISEVSRGIKALAKELDIPIIVLAQLNRRSEEANREPALHNLRESGAIEQDADIVMLLHRDKNEETENDPHSTTTNYPYILNIAKQRNGPTARIHLIFESQYTRFVDPIRHQLRNQQKNDQPPDESNF
ncbi:MAG: replicative DNA helicase [Methylacidiphilales bacterium]|nr:replicative DNA helicase [Candidatus Methylacidiphilales bacterium]MDW8349391.1 replicative DNA helicase [Verrucomicrobiae bacterium]